MCVCVCKYGCVSCMCNFCTISCITSIALCMIVRQQMSPCLQTRKCKDTKHDFLDCTIQIYKMT